MSADLLTVLTADPAAAQERAPELDDSALWGVYEALVRTRVLDAQVSELQQAGAVGFWVPSAEAAAVSVGAGCGLEDGDWYFAGFRDAGAFVARGGSIEQYIAQVVGSADDPARGRSVAGQACLPEGRFVPASGALAAHLPHAAGAALAMKLQGAGTVALASFGAAALLQSSVQAGLTIASRTAAPVIFLCRTPDSHPQEAELRAGAAGVEVVRVDGSDVLAVLKAVRTARESALSGGPVLVNALVSAAGIEDPAQDAAARLRPFLEYRGLWNPGKEEKLQQRSAELVSAAIEAARAMGPAAVDTVFDDVYATRSWTLQEQSEKLRRSHQR